MAQGTRWGAQLYTVRDQIDENPAATLKQIAAIGYKELEVIQPTLTTVAGFEWATGFYLNPTSPEEAAQVLRDART